MRQGVVVVTLTDYLITNLALELIVSARKNPEFRKI